METATSNRNALNVVTNQPNRNDLLAKIRPVILNKPNLVQHLSRVNPIPITSGLKILSTRIQSNDDQSHYQPLVAISDNDRSDEEDFVSPIHKLTKNELREELKTFRQNGDSTRNDLNHALLANDNDEDTGDLEFRTSPPVKHSICCFQYPLSFQESFCSIS